MNHFKTERKAIYDTAKFFTEYGWFFREQPIIDLGIDALVETPIDEKGQIHSFALQIKGGDSHFQQNKNGLSFYFSERHYFYWNAISENHPLFIIIQASSGVIYWQEYKQEYISKTSKKWKLNIPLKNILNESTKDRILEILLDFKNKSFFKIDLPIFTPKKIDELKIDYSKSHEAKKSIHIHLKYRKKTAILDLFYKPKRGEWNNTEAFLDWESQYYYSLRSFERYINLKFEETDKSISSFNKLVEEIKMIINNDIENIQEFIFDHENKDNDVPKYSDFLKAFEFHSKLKRNQYEAQALGSIIHIKTKKGHFEISCCESLTEHLRSYINRRSYDEIYTQTELHIWSDIYTDMGIKKSEFIPVMQRELELYWETLYKTIQENIGRTSHLDNRREKSWRVFRTFIDLYNDAGDIIELAYDFDEMILYPIAVISMLEIFNAEVCYDEYCELEFYNGEWESICIDDEGLEAPIFNIRNYWI